MNRTMRMYRCFAAPTKVQAQQLLRKPPALSWEEASCYGLKLFTAYRMLFVKSGLRPGQTMLVQGATGGAMQFASPG